MQIYSIVIFVGLVAASHQSNFLITQKVVGAWKKSVAPYISSCMCRTGIRQNIMDKFMNRGEISKDYSFKCSLTCLGQEMQIISTSGNVDLRRASQMIAGVNSSMVKKCGRITHDDVCEKTYQMLKCAYRILTGQNQSKSSSLKLWDMFSRWIG